MDKPTTKRRASANVSEDFNESVEETQGFIDSESGNIADSLTKILNVPTETISPDRPNESREDVLEGFSGSRSSEPNWSGGPNAGGNFKESYEQEEFGAGIDESTLFEDNELLAQIGVELIDMMMTYGAMAIAKDWENEEKYAIKEKRKKRLEAPLQKILENRQVKTAPELVFSFMLIVTYSPMMVMAVQERRKKKAEQVNGPVSGERPVVKTANFATAQPVKETFVNFEEEGEDLNLQDFGIENAPVEVGSDPMAQMMAQMQPKRKKGRPAGSSDLNVRNAMDGVEREKAIEKAKAYRKDGWSFARIAKTMNVSVATAIRWCRS